MIALFKKLKKLIARYITALHWQSVVSAIAVYVGGSWLLLNIAGEDDITDAGNFFYWLVVTASTVGYGDFSPTTLLGKWVTALWVIPLGLGLFGLAIGRIVAFVSFHWRKGVLGLKALELKNHILVIGWDEQHTVNLLKLLLREERYGEGRRVVLCTRSNIENPMPEEIDFVKVSSYSDDEEMNRTALMSASCIIIDTPDDHTTMASALYCNSRTKDIHTIVYFDDESLHKLLKQHCPQIECTPSVSIEMLAKAAVDPGSSLLHHELLNVDDGMTQYSTIYPLDKAEVSVDSLFLSFKQQYEATVIALKYPDSEKLMVNPSLQAKILPGTVLFYIADERIKRFDW